ncbi:MAG: enoyl-CoA hydratase/isomerase family protein [Desulfobacterales bacterium]
MKNVVLEDQGAIAVMRLTSGVTNAIGPEMVEDLAAALQEVQGRFRGMVLAGGSKFFSIGLDLPALLKLDRAGMREFWVKFEDAVLGLYTLPVPTAAAITGHAPAAGTILALTCDFRLISAGKSVTGLNEIRIGLPVPFLADLMLRQIAGDRAATEIEYTGELLAPQKAQALNLVDSVLPQEEVEAKAIAQVSEILKHPPFGFALTKQLRTRDIRAQFLAGRESVNRAFMDCWFSDPVQRILKEASKKF